MILPVILSGGYGGRLWPLSRQSKPKQFFPLLSDHTMLQETVLRLSGVPNLQDPLFICNVKHRFMVAEQMHDIGIESFQVYLEPVGRNTAPAIAIAALEAIARDPEAILLVMPSDQAIQDKAQFHRALDCGVKLAQSGHLVTFGIIPHVPKTGYGYIRRGHKLPDKLVMPGFSVKAFVEKPDRKTAARYLSSGEYDWNSGIFMMQAKQYIDELKAFAPEILTHCQAALHAARRDVDFTWLKESDFALCPDISIDYAVMEKTSRAVVIPVSMGWSDLGSWAAVWEASGQDAHGNVCDGHVFQKDISNCYIRSSKEVVAMLGLQNLIVIETDDALLVAHMDKEQEVRDVFKKLM